MKRANVMTVAGAADELGVTTTRIRQWLDDGTLVEVATVNQPKRARGRPRLLDAESVFNLKRQRELAGTEY